MSISSKSFGFLPNGEEVFLYSITNINGLTATFSTLGCCLQSVLAPDTNNNFADVVLGYDKLDDYLNTNFYMGETVGRYANRIANAQFELNGEVFKLDVNNGPNALHGGLEGFNRRNWKAFELENLTDTIVFSLESPDGDQGFPGNLSVRISVNFNDDNELSIQYMASTDKTTILNLTNHAYFNLNPDLKDVLNHEVCLNATNYLPVNENCIPTGEIASVLSTPFDFTIPKNLGNDIENTENKQIAIGAGYDHSFVLNQDSTLSIQAVGFAFEPISGRKLEVFTTEPSVHLYTGNYLNNSVLGKNGASYLRRSGFCFETQHFPDSPNQKHLPSVVLKPGEVFESKTIYKFTVNLK
ncbi:MAG: galactose mutarotase [Pseudarcicella sp.]|nr:galactose mutarotase [Pseudarcicella sp.]MBP6410208.1 galactose mutarotase [Pseudarcicella sp.]